MASEGHRPSSAANEDRGQSHVAAMALPRSKWGQLRVITRARTQEGVHYERLERA